METKDLKEAVNKLKSDLQKRVIEFNKETGLDISGAIIEGILTENTLDGQSLIKAYHVGVDIQL